MEWSFVLRIYNALTIVHWKSTMNLSLLNAHEDFSIQNKREKYKQQEKKKCVCLNLKNDKRCGGKYGVSLKIIKKKKDKEIVKCWECDFSGSF